MAAEDEPDGDHPARQRLRDDPLEAIEHGFADFGLDYGNPDFVRYAEAYGAPRPPGRQCRGLPAAAGALPGHARVHVIDCPVDYSENDRILNVELRERALAV